MGAEPKEEALLCVPENVQEVWSQQWVATFEVEVNDPVLGSVVDKVGPLSEAKVVGG